MKKNANRYSARPLGKGYFVSNDTRVTHMNSSDLIIGGTGSSKTGSITFSQLKALDKESLVVVDTKRVLYNMFEKELKGKGFDVCAIDFVNPEKSNAGYNPLSYIRRYQDGSPREQDIITISEILIPDDYYGHDPFWAISARIVVQFLIAYCVSVLPKEDHNMFTIGELFRMYITEEGAKALSKWVIANPNSFAAKRFKALEAYRAAEKTMSSIYAFVNMGLAPFDNLGLKNIYDNDNPLDLHDIGRKKTVLFINQSDCDRSQDMLVALLYTQLFQSLIYEADDNGGQLDIPVRCILDDFGSAARIRDFDKIISVVRSRDIFITICTQSISQLYDLYNDNQAKTIINNCDHIIYMGSNDMETANFIGTRANKPPETIMCMPRDKQYVLEAGKKAELMDKIPPYSFGKE